MDLFPPDGVMPVHALECSRDGCTADATTHVILELGAAPITTCELHLQEVRQYVYYAIHPYEPVCDAVDRVYLVDENRCVTPGEWGRHLAAEAARPVTV